MIRKLGSLIAAGVLSLGVSVSSHAAFISGTVGFSGTIDAATLSDIVLPITTFTPEGSLGVGGGGTGDFAAVVFPTAATANPFDILAIGGTIYEVAGFSFEVDTVGFLGGVPLTCNAAGLCEDSISLILAGTVSAAGFDDTAWIGNFTANGTCLLDGAGCADGSRSGSWSSTIAALEVPPEDDVVPVPATILLLGLGLAGMGAARRRRA